MNLTSDSLRRVKRVLLLGIAGALSSASAIWAPAQTEPTSGELEFFERNVRPVLVERCYQCHSHDAEKLKGGLYLDSLAGALAGGDTGPSIEPGHPEKSLLVEAIGYRNTDLEMPPKGKLDDAAIADLTRWVEMGAPWPEENAPTSRGLLVEEFDFEKRRAKHWCWQPVRKTPPPTVKATSWPESDIDRFVLARLENAQLKPAPPAERRALVRRAYFDLTGLPPGKSDVDAFLAEESPEAFECLVDRLLDSPHFGERWGRHWLDLVRYAETLGHEFDYPIDHAYRYRDYVIRAFNADVPYDQLIREHIAGDLLPEPRRHLTEDYNESIIGSGFWFFHEATHAPTDVRGDEADHVDNRIDVFSKTFLGLTVSCARCHDHKFDAIATSDYYALAGYLQSSRQQDAMLDPGRRIAAAKAELAGLKARADQLLPVAFADNASADSFSRYLLAARDAVERARSRARSPASNDDELRLPAPEFIAAAARDHKVDTARLARWLTALGDSAAATPGHPLFAWAQSMTPAAHWEKIRSEIAKARDEMAPIRDTAVVFENFEGGSLDGWFLTGHAFTESPTDGAEWSAGSPHPVAKSGVMHSGLYGDHFCGVLRSPTFEISHPFLHVRMKAKNVSVRLVIDGYQLNKRHNLLFDGTILKEKDADTGGRYVWQTLDGYKGSYVGHKAWLEFVDEGDGFVALDEILFTNDPLPPVEYGPVTEEVLATAGDAVPTPEQLARAFGALWAESVTGLRTGKFGEAHEAMINWTWENDLIASGDAALANAKRLAHDRDKTVPAPVFAVAHADGTPENERIHIRGSHTNLGEEVPRRFLLALGGRDHPAPPNASGRLELADQLTDPANPLPARVMVNRIWHHLFGRGIVATVDDFGEMGQPPSHPALLDWLAADFVEHRWSIKHAIRTVMLSKTYRMSSTASPDLSPGLIAERDPDNVLLYRMPVRRLEAEVIRDAILSVSGRLDPAMFGPGVPTYLTAFMEGRGLPTAKGPLDGNGRRSVYLEIRRNFLNPMMLAFDMPSPFSTMGRRSISNVPAQALVLMNDPFVVEQSGLWARTVSAEAQDPEARITLMFESAFARPPTETELSGMRAFLDEQAGLYGENRDTEAIWADLAHVLFNKKEFIYIN